MSIAALDGMIMDATEARIPILDDGLLRGDGVFEVIRLYRGRPFGLDQHLERMARGAERLQLPLDVDAVRSDVASILAAAGPVDAALRLVVTRGGRRIAIVEPRPTFTDTIALATVTFSPTRVLDGVKSLSYAGNMLANRLAREQGADEALLVTPHGRILEGPTTSFFYVLDRALHTPPLSDRILDSTTRRVVLAMCDASERVTTRDDLARLSEAFVVSSTREIQPVRSIDGDEIESAPGPITNAAAQLVREHIEAALRPPA